MIRNSRWLAVLAGGMLLAGALGVGYVLGTRRYETAPIATETAAPAKRVLYWYDPMAPAQHFDKPGKSPYMDMPLVPKYADGAPTVGVSVASGVRQNLGIRTVVAKRGRLPTSVRVPGSVTWNLREERVLSLPVDAVVERLFVRTPFEPVLSGQRLMSVRAPAWSVALAEAAALRTARSAEGRSLQAAAGGRLRALGLPAGARVDARGAIVLTAPVAGLLSEIAVREGQAVSAGTLLLRLNGTRSVWVEAALPQAVGDGAAVGTPVEVSIDALPGESFPGRIDALLPQVDVATRTQRARIELDNADGRLAAGMFAQVAVQSSPGRERVLVPSAAVIADGRQMRVIVQDGERFVPVVVGTGRSSGGQTEILTGLSGGEQVVASGQFLIDSEANLTGALERLQDRKHDPGTEAKP